MVAGGSELHDELGIGRGGDDDIDAVIGPRRTLTDHQAAVLQPHRARFVGLDPQRTRFVNGPAADGDGAFPQFLASTAPSDANHHRLGIVNCANSPGKRGGQQQQDESNEQ